MTEMKIFSETCTVKSYETDINGNLRLFSFMNIVQELAGRHADCLGFGYEDLKKDNIAWVLARMQVKFIRIPVWKENITVETWHKGGDRLFWDRDFIVSDRDKNEIILATSSWVTIDTLTRRLRKATPIEKDYKGLNLRDALTDNAEKIILPTDMKYEKSKTVTFSDLDINDHTNNAKYIEWATDIIPLGTVSGKPPVSMTVNFNLESRYGDKIDFYISVSKKRTVIEGKRADNSIFTVQLIF